MVYYPYMQQYTKKRKTSETRPPIGDEDSIKKQAKDLAVSKSLGNKEAVPSVMPTGNQKSPSVAAQETIVNSAGRQAKDQGIVPRGGNIKGGTGIDMSMAKHAGPPAGPNNNQPDQPAFAPHNDIKQGLLRQHPPAPGSRTGGISNPPSNQGLEESQGFDNPYASGEEVEEWSDAGVSNQEDYEKWKRGDYYHNTNEDGPQHRGLGGNNNGNNGNNNGNNNDNGFGDILEQKLRDILGLDPSERARGEAGRALLAARSQAGRGQMGLSGAQLGLQSDVMGAASTRAEDYLTGMQLEAAKTGVKLESLDTAEALGLMDWAKAALGSGQSEEQLIETLVNVMHMSPEEAEAFVRGAAQQVPTPESGSPLGSPPARTAWAELGWSPPEESWWEAGNSTGVDAGIVVGSAGMLPDGVQQTSWGPGMPVRTFEIGSPASEHYRYEYTDPQGVRHFFYVPV